MNKNITVIKNLLREVKNNSVNRNENSHLVKYIISQSHKYKVTDELLCKAKEEMKFLAETYLCYLKSQRLFKEIFIKYQGKGERSINETAKIVGFKLPHDPK